MRDFLKILDASGKFSKLSVAKIVVLMLMVAVVDGAYYLSNESLKSDEVIVVQENYTNSAVNDNHSYEQIAAKSQDVVENELNTFYIGDNNTKIVFYKTTVAEFEASGDYRRNVKAPITAPEGILFYTEGNKRTDIDIRYIAVKNMTDDEYDPKNCYITGIDVAHVASDTTVDFNYCGLNQYSTVDEIVDYFGEENVFYSTSSSSEKNVTLNLPKTIVWCKEEYDGSDYDRYIYFTVMGNFSDPEKGEE